MNIVLIVPTGIGALIGGHAGDANPVSKLMASCSDILITHPNVVNASDINEMTENTWYVEGSMLDKFLEGKINLTYPKPNKILVVVNKPVRTEIINAVSASRVTIGVEADIVELNTPLRMFGGIENGTATGRIEGIGQLNSQLCGLVKNYDAIAVNTEITVSRDIKLNYFENGGINPWGYVEAKLSKELTEIFNKPVAHSPAEDIAVDDIELYCIQENKIVDPRIAPEVISICYLHSVMKGLHKAPRISNNPRCLNNDDIDFLVSPFGCWGRPHEACKAKRIPIIFVKENKVQNMTHLTETSKDSNCIFVENYLEAAGVIMCNKAGVSVESVRRPFEKTFIWKEQFNG